MGTVILLSLILVFLSVLFLGINVFFTRNRKFPNTHVSGNKALKEKGIRCATTQDRQEQKKKNLFDLINIDNTI